MAYKLWKYQYWNDEDGYTPNQQAKYPYVASETQPDSDYQDISSILNWVNRGGNAGKDYKFIRSILQVYGSVDDTTWNTYTAQEKFELATRKAVSLARRIEVFGNSGNDYYMSVFDTNSRNCRRDRYQYAKSILLRTVSELDAFLILSLIESDNLENRYVSHGIEGRGLSTDPIEALYNFVDATTLAYYSPDTTDPFGNPLGKYQNTGIRARAMKKVDGVTDMTQAEKDTLCNAILDVLQNGNNGQ